MRVPLGRIREYWTRQWAVVSSHVEPVSFVRQSVRALQGRPLQDQTHGLKDKTAGHVFYLQNGKVARFEIQEDR
jgi:hypothetical protein